MTQRKVGVVIGTRPDAIKMAPVVRALSEDADFSPFLIATAQHRDLLDQVMALLEIRADCDLDIMQENQDLFYSTSEIIRSFQNVLEESKPDFLLVQGDTTTCLSAALAAYYLRIPLGHVEAGLRTYDKFNPYPEEMNRRLADLLSDLHLAPTPLAKENLLREGLRKEGIFVTGNTAVDALALLKDRAHPKDSRLWDVLEGKEKLILVTAHRRENFGEPLEEICQALKKISEARKDVRILYPVHPNPNVKQPVEHLLGNQARIHLVNPLDYENMLALMKRAYLILTDSGGIQEEAPSFGVPVLVLRRRTERPEGIQAGIAELVGTDRERIVEKTLTLLEDSKAHERMRSKTNPYGDGQAARRIQERLRIHFGLENSSPLGEFQGS